MDVLQGLSPSALITGGGGYRAAWARDTVTIDAAEVATLGWVDTSQGNLAAKLDAGLTGSGFYRASPLAWDDDVITWDLVATTNQPNAGQTAAQAAARLDACTPFLRLKAFAPRVRAGSDADRQKERDTVTKETQRREAETGVSGILARLGNGLKAFGLTTVAIVVVGAGAYLYLTRKK